MRKRKFIFLLNLVPVQVYTVYCIPLASVHPSGYKIPGLESHLEPTPDSQKRSYINIKTLIPKYITLLYIGCE